MNAVAHVPTVKVRREIAAPPAELFDAWLDPAKFSQWMRKPDTERCTVKTDPRVGGAFEIVMYTPNGTIPHTGIYQEITRPRRLVFTWNSPYAGSQDSLVTVDFNAKGGGTEIVLTHERLPSEEAAKGHTNGWTWIIGQAAESFERSHATA